MDATHRFYDENPLCGDEITIELHVQDGRIVESRFHGRGCVISQAATELLLERVSDTPVTDVLDIDRRVVLEELGMPAIVPARLRCALLGLEVLKGALRHPQNG
jgi:nitrogen fixation protein NifU and related proteins